MALARLLKNAHCSGDVAGETQGRAQGCVPARLAGWKLSQRVDVLPKRDGRVRQVAPDIQVILAFHRVALTVGETVAQLVRADDGAQRAPARSSAGLEGGPEDQIRVCESEYRIRSRFRRKRDAASSLENESFSRRSNVY